MKLELKRFSGRQWYHQRFDGCPMFIGFIAEAELKREKRKPAGTEADVRVCFFGEGKADWYLDMKDVRRGGRTIINLAKKDRRISTKLLRLWRRDERRFEQFFRHEFPRLTLKRLSDPALSRLWRKYCLLAINRLSSSSIIDHFALGTDELIGQMLRRELKGAWKQESEFTKIFSVATAPVHQSFINQAEIDLLKIIVGQSKQTLRSFQKRYFWTRSNYVTAQVLTVKDFKQEVQSWKASGKDLQLELKRIKQTPELNKRKKAALLRKHKLSRLLKILLKISEDFTWWQDERKKATYFNIHMGCELLKEIGGRTGYKVEELKYAVIPEIETIIRNTGPSRKELIVRSKQSVFVAQRSGYIIKTGSAVEQVRKIILGDKKTSAMQDFRGLSASTGKAIGTVRIVKSATEVAKVKQGDILVAVMTRPDYVVAMKKAAAIVTNEGGITSHAAIVSRELGIPCIIGTKIATEVLKDGDLVEVNANHGWVRLVSTDESRRVRKLTK